jgi:hypothetical protein
MSNSLQQRAQQFLQRPVPPELDYVSGSMAERLIAAYAKQGAAALDDEARELLEICLMETESAIDEKTGAARDYLQESADILQGIAGSA